MGARRRYLTFSLRTFFILLTSFAVWLGVVVHRAREQRKFEVEVEGFGGTVTYDWQLRNLTGPEWPLWLRRLVGDEFFQDVCQMSFDVGPHAVIFIK